MKELYGKHQKMMNKQMEELYEIEPIGENKKMTGSMGEIPCDIVGNSEKEY